MAKKTRTELSTSAINTNLPDNTQELITPTTERAQLTDERESVINYKDDLGGTGNAGKFLTVATDGESLTMVDEPSGVPDWVTFVTAVNNLMKLTSGGNSGQIQFFDTDGTTLGAQISWVDGNNKLVIYNAQGQEEINLTGGKILLKTGGVTALTIDSSEATFSGNVEVIKSSTPTIQLTQSGATNYKGYVKLAGNDLEIRGSSGAMEFYNGSVDGNSSALRMSISSTGVATFSNYIDTPEVRQGGEFMIGRSSNIIRMGSGDASDSLAFYAGGSQAMSISTGGLATFQNGIKFGGTPSPAYDSGADTLDAYEEGTWTGQMNNDGYGNTATGTYVRIGDLVYVQIYFAGRTINSAGSAIVSGLPYSATASGSLGYGIISYLHGDSVLNSKGGYVTGGSIYNVSNNSDDTAIWNTGTRSSMWSGAYKIN